MGKLNFISVLCLSLALLANPLIGMQYCTVHHHFLDKTAETHVHAEHCASWSAGLHEENHETPPLKAFGLDFPAEICGCAVHEHSGACESMLPAEFFIPESLSVFYFGDSGAFASFTAAILPQDFSHESAIRYRLGPNGFGALSSWKVRTHLLKSVLVI